MDDRQRLRVLLPHWIEHNQEHAAELRDYAGRAGDAQEKLLTAARLLEEANAQLDGALAELGGPVEQHHP